MPGARPSVGARTVPRSMVCRQHRQGARYPGARRGCGSLASPRNETTVMPVEEMPKSKFADFTRKVESNPCVRG